MDDRLCTADVKSVDEKGGTSIPCRHSALTTLTSSLRTLPPGSGPLHRLSIDRTSRCSLSPSCCISLSCCAMTSISLMRCRHSSSPLMRSMARLGAAITDQLNVPYLQWPHSLHRKPVRLS